MIEKHDATASVYRCDVPRCLEEHVTYTSEGLHHWTEAHDWTVVHVALGERHAESTPEDFLTLCPEHKHLRQTLELAKLVLERNAVPVR